MQRRERDCKQAESQSLASGDSVTSCHSLKPCCCRHLDLAGNRLTSLGSFSTLPVLHTLLLSGNIVSSLLDCQPEAFAHLEVLDISCNAVEPQQVAVLGHFPQLRQLNISGGRPFCVVT